MDTKKFIEESIKNIKEEVKDEGLFLALVLLLIS